MTTSDKLREIAHKYGGAIITGYGQSSASGSTEMFTAEEQCLSDLTALLEQHKEMMLREELAKYDQWLLANDMGQRFDDTIKCVDAYLEELKNVKK